MKLDFQTGEAAMTDFKLLKVKIQFNVKFILKLVMNEYK